MLRSDWQSILNPDNQPSDPEDYDGTLVLPIDRILLDVLCISGKRQSLGALNRVIDRSRSYLSERLTHLYRRGWVESPGKDRSSVYGPTDFGCASRDYLDKYESDFDAVFQQLMIQLYESDSIDTVLDNRDDEIRSYLSQSPTTAANLDIDLPNDDIEQRLYRLWVLDKINRPVHGVRAYSK